MEKVKDEPNAKKGVRGILKATLTAPELLFCMYVFGLMLHLPLLHQYVYMRFSQEENFPYHYSAAHGSCGNDQLNKTMKALQEKVQGKSARFQIGQSLFTTIPSLVVCLYLGAWSDVVGRKPVVILGTLGTLLETMVVLLTMMLDLPISVVYIGSFLNGMGGYFTGLILAVMAYIADTTSADKRALRLGIMEGVVFVGATLSNFISGHLISKYGFKIPYIIVVVSIVISCLLAIFAMQESLKNKAVKSAGCFNMACLKYPLKVWRTLSMPRPGKWKIVVLMPATLFVNMLSMGISSLITLYLMNSPFCLSPIEVGYFSGARLFLMGIGAAIGIKLLGLLMQPHFISLVGIMSYFAFYTLLAIVKDSKTVYIACLLGALSGTASPIFRSILSKTVSSNEQGVLFSAVSSLEMLAVFLGNFLFNAVYLVLNRHGNPGAIFFLVDAILLFPFLLALIYIMKIRNGGKGREDLQAIVNDDLPSNGKEFFDGYGSSSSNRH